jgi:hypothetical protein
MVNEQVSQSSTLSIEGDVSIYKLDFQSPYFALIIKDSVYSSNYKMLIDVEGASLYMNNVLFTNDQTIQILDKMN